MSVVDVSRRLLLVWGMALTACSSEDSGKTEGTGTVPLEEPANTLALDVGRISLPGDATCTVIGTQRKTKDGTAFFGAIAYHCLSDAFVCRDYPITWRGGGTSLCQGAIEGLGRGKGDFALIKIDKAPEKLELYSFPTGIGVGNALFLMGPTAAEDHASCTVLDVKDAPFRVTHDCAKGRSPGLSGAPLFRLEGTAKRLVGMHVGHSATDLEATLWPVVFLRQHLTNGPQSAAVGRAQDSAYTQCQQGFYRYLSSKSVSGTHYTDEFLRNARAYIEANRSAFADYLKTDLVPFHLKLAGTCQDLAQGDILGQGLLYDGDQCGRSGTDAGCMSVCCTDKKWDATKASRFVGCQAYRARTKDKVCLVP